MYVNHVEKSRRDSCPKTPQSVRKTCTVRRPEPERPIAKLIPMSKFFPDPDLIALHFNTIQPPYIVSISRNLSIR